MCVCAIGYRESGWGERISRGGIVSVWEESRGFGGWLSKISKSKNMEGILGVCVCVCDRVIEESQGRGRESVEGVVVKSGEELRRLGGGLQIF